MTLAATLIDPLMIPIIVVPTVFLGTPLAIAYARRLWRDADRQRHTALPDETAQRLMQLQQSMDAMAVEIERISEGQRFVTKVLASRDQAALPAGDASAKAPERDRLPPASR